MMKRRGIACSCSSAHDAKSSDELGFLLARLSCFFAADKNEPQKNSPNLISESRTRFRLRGGWRAVSDFMVLAQLLI